MKKENTANFFIEKSDNDAFTDFYQLCDVMKDDIADVAIIISHIMYLSGRHVPLTLVRRDLMSIDIDIIKKYDVFIKDALDMPILELRQICSKKLANTTQLRAKIRELQQKIDKYENKK
jgi:hypothetical protein